MSTCGKQEQNEEINSKRKKMRHMLFVLKRAAFHCRIRFKDAEPKTTGDCL